MNFLNDLKNKKFGYNMLSPDNSVLEGLNYQHIFVISADFLTF